MKIMQEMILVLVKANSVCSQIIVTLVAAGTLDKGEPDVWGCPSSR